MFGKADMIRGPKPKPTAQKKLEGNPGRRPLNDAEPMPPPVSEAFDAPPVEFEGNPGASAEWQRLVPMLRRARQITDADRSVLLSLCVEWSRYLAATKEIQLKGMVILAPSGYPIVNPYLPIANKALAACTKLWPELGLTPSSRSRLKETGPGPGGDAFTEFDQVLPATGTKH
jgi:P27 family predicted phage terminase small subunit